MKRTFSPLPFPRQHQSFIPYGEEAAPQIYEVLRHHRAPPGPGPPGSGAPRGLPAPPLPSRGPCGGKPGSRLLRGRQSGVCMFGCAGVFPARSRRHRAPPGEASSRLSLASLETAPPPGLPVGSVSGEGAAPPARRPFSTGPPPLFYPAGAFRPRPAWHGGEGGAARRRAGSRARGGGRQPLPPAPSPLAAGSGAGAGDLNPASPPPSLRRGGEHPGR